MSKQSKKPLMRRIRKRFTLPDYCDVREVVIRELDSEDEITVAMWMEVFTTSAIGDNMYAQMKLEQREQIRCSLVEVDGQPVNVDGVPYAPLTQWSQRTFRHLMAFFTDVNGIPPEELKNCVAAGQLEVDDQKTPTATAA